MSPNLVVGSIITSFIPVGMSNDTSYLGFNLSQPCHFGRIFASVFLTNQLFGI